MMGALGPLPASIMSDDYVLKFEGIAAARDTKSKMAAYGSNKASLSGWRP